MRAILLLPAYPVFLVRFCCKRFCSWKKKIRKDIGGWVAVKNGKHTLWNFSLMLWEVHRQAPTTMHYIFLDHHSGVVVRLRKSTLAKVWHNLPEADQPWLPCSHFLRTSSGFVLSVCGGKRWLNDKYADSSWTTPDHKWFNAALALSLQSYFKIH